MSNLPEPPSTVDTAFGSSLIAVKLGRAEGRTVVPAESAGLSWLAPVTDLISAHAYTSELESSQSCVTVSLRLDFTGDETAPGQSLSVRARSLPTTSSTGLAQAQIVTDDQRPIAVATTRFAALPSPGRGHGFDPTAVLTGFDDLRRAADLELLISDDRSATFTITPDELLGNPSRVLHGGAQISIAELAMTDWLDASKPGDRPTLISITAEYLAPILVDGAAVPLELTAVRIGRSMARVNLSILTPRGTVGTVINATLGLSRTAG